jgi:hypothetical protein
MSCLQTCAQTEKCNQELDTLTVIVAPAIMVNDEIVVEGGNASQEEVEACICRHL